jgi:hypothetical protein
MDSEVQVLTGEMDLYYRLETLTEQVKEIITALVERVGDTLARVLLRVKVQEVIKAQTVKM